MLSNMACCKHIWLKANKCLPLPTLVGKNMNFNVVHLAQNEANYKDLLFNNMVQQTSWQAIYVCIIVVKTCQCGLLSIFQ